MNEFATDLVRLDVPFIPYAKAAAFIGVDERAVIGRVHAKLLPLYIVPLPGGGLYQLVRVSDLVAWCEERQAGARPKKRKPCPGKAQPASNAADPWR